MCYSLIDSVENVSIFLGGGGGGEVPIHFLKLRFTLYQIEILEGVSKCIIQVVTALTRYKS